VADAKAMQEFIDNEGAKFPVASSRDLLKALRRYYRSKKGPWNELKWSFFEELPVGPGRNQQRIDAWTISRNAGVVEAFELKVSRHDFLTEVNDLSKMQAALALSNRFWFVVPAGHPIARPEELPSEAGLISIDLADHGRLAFLKNAPHRAIAEPTWEFVAVVAGAKEARS
jgi:hypothetical protein